MLQKNFVVCKKYCNLHHKEAWSCYRNKI